jgi:hypothetical protein
MRHVLAVIIGLVLGGVGAEYFKPTPETTPSQQAARATLRWCPPDSHVQCAIGLNRLSPGAVTTGRSAISLDR